MDCLAYVQLQKKKRLFKCLKMLPQMWISMQPLFSTKSSYLAQTITELQIQQLTEYTGKISTCSPTPSQHSSETACSSLPVVRDGIRIMVTSSVTFSYSIKSFESNVCHCDIL